jgi:bifunctional DNase/RNase
MIEAEIWTIARRGKGTQVTLKLIGSETGVPVFVGQDIVLPEVSFQPPIHDLFLELAKRMGLALFRIEIGGLEDDMFFARVLLSGRDFSEDRPLVLEGQSGDIFALAVRTKCAIYVSQELVEAIGVPVNFLLEEISRAAGATAFTL